MTGLCIELIGSDRALEDLTTDWAGLWGRCPAATPFQSPEWLLAWWKAFHPGRLAAAALRWNGRLAGLAPLYVDGRTARPLGISVSDYLDVLLEPGLPADVLPRMLEHSAGAGWDICEWPDLPARSPLLDGRATQCQVCPVAALPAHPTPALARNLRRYRERLERDGEMAFETMRSAGALGDLLRLHRARWTSLGGAGMLDSPAVVALHAAAAAGFSARGWLRFYVLRRRAAAIAVLYAFACRRRLYLYLSGFDPAFARYSPSALLLHYALGQAAAENLAEADFLRGNESYKYQWGARNRITYTVRIERLARGLLRTV
jgi:CelD/BcsL family acetyltransferase involved in cellulose biosynthesis